MSECKILTFRGVGVKSRQLKQIPGPNPSYFIEMTDYPVVEQEINAYLRAGYSVQNISRTPDNVMTVILVR